MIEWLRPLIFSALNRSSSHCCGFERCSCHMWDTPSSACRWQVVFLRDLPFLPHLMIDLAQNEWNNLDGPAVKPQWKTIMNCWHTWVFGLIGIIWFTKLMCSGVLYGQLINLKNIGVHFFSVALFDYAVYWFIEFVQQIFCFRCIGPRIMPSSKR